MLSIYPRKFRCGSYSAAKHGSVERGFTKRPPRRLRLHVLVQITRNKVGVRFILHFNTTQSPGTLRTIAEAAELFRNLIYLKIDLLVSFLASINCDDALTYHLGASSHYSVDGQVLRNVLGRRTDQKVLRHRYHSNSACAQSSVTTLLQFLTSTSLHETSRNAACYPCIVCTLHAIGALFVCISIASFLKRKGNTTIKMHS